jgi:putative transposase
MSTRSRQLELPISTWGGRRRGAGRKPAPGRRKVPHRRRVTHDGHCPAHVTLRATSGLPSLRQDRAFSAVRSALCASSRRGFRVIHFSVQRDHLHLLVEADTPVRFTRGLQGLAIRVAKAVNRVLGRHGRVWADRFHTRLLRTPREVRNALVYVLNNWRKHLRGSRGLDARFSARCSTVGSRCHPRRANRPRSRRRERGLLASGGGGAERSALTTCLDLPEDEAVEAPAPSSPGRADRGLRQLAARAAGCRSLIRSIGQS